MTDASFLETIVANEWDRAPRAVFADFLDERGDERAEVMRSAPTCWQALAGFPEWRPRLYPSINIQDSPLTDLGGKGPWNVTVGTLVQETEPRAIARLVPSAGPVRLFEVLVENSWSKVGATVQLADESGRVLLCFPVSPSGLFTWYPAAGASLLIAGPILLEAAAEMVKVSLRFI